MQVTIFSTSKNLINGTMGIAVLKSARHEKTVSCVLPQTKSTISAEVEAIKEAIKALKKPNQTKVIIHTTADLNHLLKKPEDKTIRELRSAMKNLREVKIAENTSILNPAQMKIPSRHFEDENFKTSPTPRAVKSCPSLEHFLAAFLKSPEYGTRKKIEDISLIKAILEKVEKYRGLDTSYYNGYSPQIEKNAREETITLSVDENYNLVKNGKRLHCNLKDHHFDGMRVNIYTTPKWKAKNGIFIEQMQILLDFFYPDEAYRKKCVKFLLNPKQKVSLKTKPQSENKNTAQKTNLAGKKYPIQQQPLL